MRSSLERKINISYGYKNRTAKIVFIIFAALTAVFLALSILFSALLPSPKLLTADEGESFYTAIKWKDMQIFASSKGMLRFFKEGNLQETYNLQEQVLSQFELSDSDVGKINSLCCAVDGNDLFVYTQRGYIFRITLDNLALTHYYKLDGENCLFNKVVDDELYLVTKKESYIKIYRFDIQNIANGPLSEGYFYDLTLGSGGKFTLQFVKDQAFNVQTLDVVGDTIYITTGNQVYRMNKDFSFNNFETVIVNKLAQLQSEGLSQQQALEQTIAQLDLIDYNLDKGTVVLSKTNFNQNKYCIFNYDEVTFRGACLDANANKYYVVTQKEDYLYSFEKDSLQQLTFGDVVEISKEKVTLGGTPSNDGNAIYFDEKNNVAFVTYASSNLVTRVDLNTLSQYTVTLEFNINHLLQYDGGEEICFIYKNSVEAESGTNLVKTINVSELSNSALNNLLFNVSAILCVIVAIIAVISLLCFVSKKFLRSFLDVVASFKKHKIVYCIVLSALALTVTFCYYPAIGSISMSFFNYERDNPSMLWNDFANYKEVFTNDRAGQSFLNMFIFLAADLILSIIPPLIFAFFLTLMKSKGYSNFTRTMMFVCGIMPGVATLLIWKTGIYGQNGAINWIVVNIFGGERIHFLDSPSAIWAIVMMGFPFVGSYLIFYGALMNVPTDFHDAAEVDGISVWTRFFKIDLPLIFPQLKYVFVMAFINSVQNFSRTYMIDSAGTYVTSTPIHTMYVAMQNGQYGLASAYATIMFVFLFFATLFILRAQLKDAKVK